MSSGPSPIDTTGVTPARSSPASFAGAALRPLALLGRGGMADVILAASDAPDGDMGSLCVLKQLRDDLVSDRVFCAMFADEARLAARLDHPNVVKTYDVVQRGGAQAIVLEYLDGQTLSSISKRLRERGERIPLGIHLRILCEVLAGLHHAHELRDADGRPFELVHRDVSPQNVMVTFDGKVKVLDFGIAKAVGTSNETRTGVLKGKLGYMAPEQMTGEQIDRRADVYSVGVMLWEAAVGQPLWHGVSDVRIMNRVVNGDVPTPTSVAPSVSPQLEAIIVRAMATAPEGRYETAAALKAAIEALAEHESGLGARDVGAFVTSVFDDVREEIKAVVDAQLQRLESLPAAEFAALSLPNLAIRSVSLHEGVEVPTRRDPLKESAPRTTNRAAVLSTPEPQAPSAEGGRARKLAALGLVALLAIGGVGVVLTAGRGHDRAASLHGAAGPAVHVGDAPTAVMPAAPGASTHPSERGASSVVAAEGGEVTLRITAMPPSARLFFDGAPMGVNPVTRTASRGPSRHVVRAEAPGYLPREVEVTFEQSTAVTLTLERRALGKASTPAGSSSVAASPTTPAKPDCSSPFFVDERGIKRIRPECTP